MALLLLIAGGIGFWMWRTGRLASLSLNDGLFAALALLGVRLLTTGRVLAGAALVASSVGWAAYRARRISKAEAMSLGEARALLELSPDADGDAIRAAHRRLIARVHPDAGGSEALARNVNLARDILLKDLHRTTPNSARGA